MALVYYALALIAITILLTHLRSAFKPPSSRLPFPKGPKTLFFLGNLHQIPLNKSFLTFKIWSRSPTTSNVDGLLGLQLGPTARAVVLDKWTHVRDLFDSRAKGAIYSDRPHLPITDFVIPNTPETDLHPAFAKYGPKWRRARRTIVEFLSERQLEKMLAVQDAESSQMIWEFLQFCGSDAEAEMFAYHRYVMRSFGAVILETVFGIRGKYSDESNRVMRFFTVTDEWAAMAAPGATPPTDLFPWLANIPDFLTPWKGWKKKTESLRHRQQSLYRELFSDAETTIKAGKSKESLIARLLEDKETAMHSGAEKDVYSQLELDYICGFLLEAGADTTVMAFETFILAMATNPDIQKQAQREVDAVFGPHEMPHKTDEGKLPFLKACFLEVSPSRPKFVPDSY